MSAHQDPLTRVFSFAPDVVVQVIDGDALLLQLQREEVFALNATGARIAQLVEQGLDQDAMVDVLTDEYGVDRQHVAGDVSHLLQTLLAKGLIVLRPEPPQPEQA